MAEKINRQVKSSLFIDYFGMDEVVGKRNFLELYNAIHDTNYTLENTTLKIREINDTIYLKFVYRRKYQFPRIYKSIRTLANTKICEFLKLDD